MENERIRFNIVYNNGIGHFADEYVIRFKSEWV